MNRTKSLLLFLVMASCSISSRNPVQPLSEDAGDSSSLLGTWDLVEFAEGNLELPNRVEVRAGIQGELVLAIGDHAEPLTRTAFLAEVGDLQILSIQNRGSWYIIGFELEENDQRLLVHILNQKLVQQEVEAGALQADMAEFSFDEQVIQLTSSSTELAEFLLENPQIFEERAAVLERAN